MQLIKINEDRWLNGDAVEEAYLAYRGEGHGQPELHVRLTSGRERDYAGAEAEAVMTALNIGRGVLPRG